MQVSPFVFYKLKSSGFSEPEVSYSTFLKLPTFAKVEQAQADVSSCKTAAG